MLIYRHPLTLWDAAAEPSPAALLRLLLCSQLMEQKSLEVTGMKQPAPFQLWTGGSSCPDPGPSCAEIAQTYLSGGWWRSHPARSIEGPGISMLVWRDPNLSYSQAWLFIATWSCLHPLPCSHFLPSLVVMLKPGFSPGFPMHGDPGAPRAPKYLFAGLIHVSCL